MIKKYLIALRIIVWAPFLFSFIFGLMDSQLINFHNSFLALISVCLTLGSANYLNSISDIEIDKHNPRKKDIKMNKQPFSTSEISIKSGYMTITILLILSFFTASLVSYKIVILNIVGMFLAIFYSFGIRLKEKPPFDIIANALAAGILPYVTALIANNGAINLFTSSFFFAIIVPPYVNSLIGDVKYDKKSGVNTSATKFGIRKMIKVSLVFRLLSVILLFSILISMKRLWYLPFLINILSIPTNFKQLKKKKVKISERASYITGVIILIIAILMKVLINV